MLLGLGVWTKACVRACAAGPAGAERQRAQCAGLPPRAVEKKGACSGSGGHACSVKASGLCPRAGRSIDHQAEQRAMQEACLLLGLVPAGCCPAYPSCMHTAAFVYYSTKENGGRNLKPACTCRGLYLICTCADRTCGLV
jgi:hypothetical protein